MVLAKQLTKDLQFLLKIFLILWVPLKFSLYECHLMFISCLFMLRFRTGLDCEKTSLKAYLLIFKSRISSLGLKK